MSKIHLIFQENGWDHNLFPSKEAIWSNAKFLLHAFVTSYTGDIGRRQKPHFHLPQRNTYLFPLASITAYK